jgi:putative ABC transport system ATP-binding protein
VSLGPLIRLSGIEKTYGHGPAAFQALRGIDLEVQQGEFLAIMGPSGSGKSTTMNIVGCLDTPTKGRFEFEGLRVDMLSRDQRALLRRHRLGFVFQGFNLLPKTTALENVELPLIYRRAPAATRRQFARAALHQVGLAEWGHHTPAELSGGQQQRVAIARAIVTRPALLLADEPTGSLDSRTTDEVMRLLVGINQSLGITIVMVTHEARVAVYAHSVVHFLDGRIDTVRLNPESS